MRLDESAIFSLVFLRIDTHTQFLFSSSNFLTLFFLFQNRFASGIALLGYESSSLGIFSFIIFFFSVVSFGRATTGWVGDELGSFRYVCTSVCVCPWYSIVCRRYTLYVSHIPVYYYGNKVYEKEEKSVPV